MIQQKLPARNIEPDGRLVEQQEPGAMQQGACDLDAPPLAAAQQADLIPAPLFEPDAFHFGRNPLGRFATREPMKGAMVKEVLLERQIEVEGRLLEHDPHQPQALQRLLADIHAEDTDHPLTLRIKPGRKRKQRRLPGAVQP